jgi:tetratricopeptide (TPR) repeat protein
MADEPDNSALVSNPDAEDVLLTDAEKRRKLEAELARMGMSPDEVRRLMNADARTHEATLLPPSRLAPSMEATLPPLPAPVAVKAKPAPNRTTEGDLMAYAAELTRKAEDDRREAIVQATQSLDFPPFRESTLQETLQAEAIMRDAAMLRRRERYTEALAKCMDALRLVPKDAAALELLGDILQGIARTDEALAAYKRATEADPKRSSAEKKYGDLLMRQSNWNIPDGEAATGQSAWLAVALSVTCPGAGQFYLGESSKALFFLLSFAACLSSLWFTSSSVGRFGTARTFLFVLAAVIYIANLIDANIIARKRR